MLTLCNTGLADIHAELTAVNGLHQLGKAAAFVTVHLKIEDSFLFRKIAQIGRVELFRKAVIRDLRHNKRIRLSLERLQQINYFTKCYFVSSRHIAELAVFIGNDVQPVVVAGVSLALDSVKHFFNQIVNVEQFKLCRTVINLYRQIICDIIAESRNSTVVIRSAPLAEQVRETVNVDLRARFFCVVEKQVLARKFASAILAIITSDKCSLQGR